jgi:hypothetical protein
LEIGKMVMGLDLVEFAMSVEDAFGTAISDADWAILNTPGQLIDALARSLPSATEGGCLTQRAFYALRQAVMRHSPTPIPPLRPDTSLVELWSDADRAPAWAAVGRELDIRDWPRLAKPGWLDFVTPRRRRLAGDVARHMVTRHPLGLKTPGEGWTRAQVAEVIHGQIREELGLSRGSYTESSQWVADMGVD